MSNKMLCIVTCLSAMLIHTTSAFALAFFNEDSGTDVNNTSFDWSTFHSGLHDIKTTPVPIPNNTMIPVTNATAAYRMDTEGPSYASALAFTGGAVNLEVVYSVAIDGFQPRFRKGMDPHSAWFKEMKSADDSAGAPDFIYSEGEEHTLASRDLEAAEHEQNNGHKKHGHKKHGHKKHGHKKHGHKKHGHKKHNPRPGFHWHGHHSTKRIAYGHHSPGSVISQLSKHCSSLSCDNSRYSLDSYYTEGQADCPTVTGRNDGKLIVTPAGDGWTGKTRKHFMQAIAVISHVRAKHKKMLTGERCHYYQGNCYCDTHRNQKVYHGGKYFGINLVHKFGHHAVSEGYVQAEVRFVDTGLDACSLIISALEHIADFGGPIGAIGGGFFGEYAEQNVCEND